MERPRLSSRYALKLMTMRLKGLGHHIVASGRWPREKIWQQVSKTGLREGPPWSPHSVCCTFVPPRCATTSIVLSVFPAFWALAVRTKRLTHMRRRPAQEPGGQCQS